MQSATRFCIALSVLWLGIAPDRALAGESFRWRLIDTAGTSPLIDSANVFSIPGENAIGFFGGYREAPDVTGSTVPTTNAFFNDVVLFDASSETWSVVPVTGDRPAARAFSCAAYHAPTRALYVFGGSTFANDFGVISGIPFVFFGDTWRFDFASSTWTDLTATAGTAPSPRAGSGCALVGGELYLFSGNTEFFQPTNDLWAFDVLSETWRLVEASDGSSDPERPVDRALSLMAGLPDGDRFILAGGDSFVDGPHDPTSQEDVWVYSRSTGAWAQLRTRNKPAIARLHQAFAVTSNRFFMTQNGDAQGDTTPQDSCRPPLLCFVALTPTRDTFFYDVVRQRWIKKRRVALELPPTRRSMMALLGDTLYLFGGYDFDGTSGADSVGKIPNTETYKLVLRDRFLEDGDDDDDDDD